MVLADPINLHNFLSNNQPKVIQMKHLYKSIVALSLLLPLGATTSFAEVPQKVAEPVQSGVDINQGMGAGTKGIMTLEQKDQHLRAMQDQMLIMHNLSNQILAETDPVKKEELKNQQLQLMKSQQQVKRKTHRQEKKEQRQQMKIQQQQMIPVQK
jgi:hypothetical protein